MRVVRPGVNRQRLAVAYLAALFAVTLYRAWSQSFVHDEAFMWERFLAVPAGAIFREFDVNNHFLQTLAAKLAQYLFGNSEFALRLPTVLAGAWYFHSVYRLCFRAFGDTWNALAGVVVLTLNPFVLDFLVICRGYGPALAFFTYGLLELLIYFDSPVRRAGPLYRAGAALGLGVTANLTFAVPSVALAAVFAGMLLWDRTISGRLAAAVRFAVPAGAIAVLFFLLSPITHAQRIQFYWGSPGALAAVWSLVDISLLHNARFWIDWRALAVDGVFTRVFAGVFLLPVTAAAAAGAFAVSRRIRATGFAKAGSGRVVLVLATGTLLLSAALLGTAHAAAGMVWPVDRTGLYLVFLFTLSAVALPEGFPSTRLRRLWIVPLACLAIAFAAQFEVSYFSVWRYDADTRAILARIPPAAHPLRLGISWEFEPAVNYYRITHAFARILPVDRSPLRTGCDYYLLAPWDLGFASAHSLRVLYRAPTSGATLAAPR